MASLLRTVAVASPHRWGMRVLAPVQRLGAPWPQGTVATADGVAQPSPFLC